MSDRSSQSPSPPAQPNCIIRASAGTGKTFQLSNRYLQCVLAGQAPDRILATTFTRKAAGEILDRILYRLACAASSVEQTERLRHEIGWPELTIGQCQQLLRKLTQQLHRLRVSTLDAFFIQITQSLSLELGLPPVWNILDERDNQRLQEQSLGRLLAEEEHATVVQLVQWLAQGETKRGVYDLLADTVAKHYGVYLASSPLAWRRMRHRKLVSDDRLSQGLATLRQLSTGGYTQSIEKALVVACQHVESHDWEGLLSSGLGKNISAGMDTYGKSVIPFEIVEAFEPLIEHAQAWIINRIVDQTQASYDLLRRFDEYYERSKLDRRAWPFGDIARILCQPKATAALQGVAYRLDAEIDSLLLDEFQDTSLAQWRVLRPFAVHACEPAPRRSFLCVGDVKQAIYGWRGGSAELLQVLPQEIPHRLEIESLDTSYRSAPAVIDAVNHIHQQLDRHDNLGKYEEIVRRWVAEFPQHATARGDLRGWVTVETSAANAKDKADEKREATFRRAAERVEELQRAAPGLSIGVLLRSNEHVGQVIYELQKRRIAASEEGGNPLHDAAAVQLIVSLLQLIDHPYDRAARFHLVHSPWGPRWNWTDERDDEVALRVRRQTLDAVLDLGIGRATTVWADEIRPWVDRREQRRLDQLVELAFQYQQRIESPRLVGHTRQTRESLAVGPWIDRIREQKVHDPTSDRVRVMTIHQSKGLQFDVVILPDLEDTWPGHPPKYVAQAPSPTDDIQTVCRYVRAEYLDLLPEKIVAAFSSHRWQETWEDLCVLYVAVTRAVYSLQMIVSPSDKAVRALDGVTANGSVSTANLMRAALTDGQPIAPNSVIYRHGDANWLSKLPPALREMPNRAEGNAEGNDDEAKVRRKVIWQRTGTGDALTGRRTREVIRPSALEGQGGGSPPATLRQLLRWDAEQAMSRGVAIHARLQAIRWWPDDVAAEFHALPETSDIASYVDAALQRPALGELLSRDFYLRRWQRPDRAISPPDLLVHCELPIVADDREGTITGTVDRLVVLLQQGVPVAADIVDYKSDHWEPGESGVDRVAFYRPQLLAYQRGVAKMLRLDSSQVSARLVFLGRGEIIEVV